MSRSRPGHCRFFVSFRRRFWLALLLGSAATLIAWLNLRSDARSLALATTTLSVVAMTALWVVPLGTALAWLMMRSDLPGRRLAMLLLVLWLFLPLYLQASAWDAGFGQQGWFSQWTGQTATPLLSGMRAVVWIHGWATLPWVVLLVGLGLRQQSGELDELALQNGTTWQVVQLVTLPLATPAIAAATIWVCLTIAGEMTVTDLYRVRTYAEELYTNFALTADATEVTIGVGPQLGLITVLLALAWLAALLLSPTGDQTSTRQQPRHSLNSARWPAALLVVGSLLLVTALPLGNLIYKAGFTVDNRSGKPVRTWSLDTFAKSTFPTAIDPRNWECGSEYATTFQLGAGVGTLTVLLAAPLAWWACRRTSGRMLTLAIIVLGLAIPGPLVGIGAIELFNRPESTWLAWLYDRTLIPTILAVTVRTLPLGLLVLWYSFRSLDRDQIELAQLDGANTMQMLRTIVVPQRWPAVAIVWLGSFALAAGDLSTSILVVPPGQITLANHIFLLIHAGVHNEEAGLCITQVALFGGLAILLLSLTRWASREH